MVNLRNPATDMRDTPIVYPTMGINGTGRGPEQKTILCKRCYCMQKANVGYTVGGGAEMAGDDERRQAAAAMGRASSPAKTAAARENGKRGGRRKGQRLTAEHRA